MDILKTKPDYCPLDKHTTHPLPCSNYKCMISRLYEPSQSFGVNCLLVVFDTICLPFDVGCLLLHKWCQSSCCLTSTVYCYISDVTQSSWYLISTVYCYTIYVSLAAVWHLLSTATQECADDHATNVADRLIIPCVGTQLENATDNRIAVFFPLIPMHESATESDMVSVWERERKRERTNGSIFPPKFRPPTGAAQSEFKKKKFPLRRSHYIKGSHCYPFHIIDCDCGELLWCVQLARWRGDCAQDTFVIKINIVTRDCIFIVAIIWWQAWPVAGVSTRWCQCLATSSLITSHENKGYDC